MFSGNHKISSRQMYRNYAVVGITLSALLPPLVMNQENTGSILLSLLFLGIYLAGTAIIERPTSIWVKWICYLHYWVLATMLLRITGLLVQQFLLTDTRLWVIMGWFSLFCYYNLYKGLECRLRVSEVLFPFFLLMLLLLTVLMHGEVELSRFRELRLMLQKEQLLIGYELFCWLSAVQSLWHLKGQVHKESDYPRIIWKVWLTTGGFILGFSLFIYCIYGNQGHTGLVFPLASAMTMAHFPGNVIGRLDALFIFAWVIGFFLLCSSLFAPLMDGEPDKKRKWGLFLLLAAAYLCACFPKSMEWGEAFLYYISTPVQIVLLLVSGVWKNNKKIKMTCLCLLPFFLLTGCSAQELEQQSLVTAIGVDVGEEEAFCFTFGFGNSKEEEDKAFETEAASIEEAKNMYWEYQQKNMDFNHLKNFYFSKELLRRTDFGALLEEIQLHASYSRGTLVYAVEEKASEEAKKEEQPEEGMPVHRLLNAWYNETSCEIPKIQKDGRYKGYITWPY